MTWAGFTGFVPRARFLIGAGYPLTTHRALVEFGQNRGSRPEAGKGSTVLPPLLKSYPTDMGLLPHYAGYVPGERCGPGTGPQGSRLGRDKVASTTGIPCRKVGTRGWLLQCQWKERPGRTHSRSHKPP